MDKEVLEALRTLWPKNLAAPKALSMIDSFSKRPSAARLPAIYLVPLEELAAGEGYIGGGMSQLLTYRLGLLYVESLGRGSSYGNLASLRLGARRAVFGRAWAFALRLLDGALREEEGLLMWMDRFEAELSLDRAVLSADTMTKPARSSLS